jgi:S1-C subfamily serine protease
LFLLGALLAPVETDEIEAIEPNASEGQSTPQPEEVIPSPNQTATGEPLSAGEVYEQSGPSVFTIQCQGFGGEYFEGTGFSYIPDANSLNAPFLVTNYHVIEACFNAGTDIYIVTASEDQFPATIQGVDPSNDLALLASNAPLEPLLPAQDARIGDTVFAIGSPLGTRGTITQGIISNIEGPIYQIDARIFQGNSGGPLLNQQGGVIGVNTQKIFERGSTPRAEGIGFSYRIQLLCEQLIACS